MRNDLIKKMVVGIISFISLLLPVAKAQNIPISGVVVDVKTGEPLQEAVVYVKENKGIGTAVDTKGNFILSVPVGATIVVSYPGYKEIETAIGDNKFFNIALEEEATILEETVVVGFSTQRRASVIGSVDQIKPAELKLPTRTISTSLAGKLAGVVAVQGSGEPGYDGASFWIRGVNSFVGNASPLILVDGIERNLDDVEPQEIADFTILKDATATAVYGVRGANGVVLITTKRGVVSAPKVNLRAEMSFSNPLMLPKFVDGVTYMRMHNEALINSGQSALYSEDKINGTEHRLDPYYYPDVNWVDELMTHWNPNEKVTLNVAGGSDRVRYFVSGAFLNQSGMYKKFGGVSYDNNINVKRYNFRSNVDVNVTKTTLLGVNVAASLEDRQYPAHTSSTIWGWISDAPPIWYPLTYPDKSKIPGHAYGVTRNPYQLIARSGYSEENHSKVQADFTVTQNLSFVTQGLQLKGQFSFDAYTKGTLKNEMRPRPYIIAPFSYQGGKPVLTDNNGNYNYVDQDAASTAYEDYLVRKDIATTYDRKVYIDARIIYNREFGKHIVGGLFLYNQSDQAFPTKSDIYESVPVRHQGITGRATYGYDDKYFAEFNFGYNGSESFAPGKKYGFFPSFAAGWVPSKESFMEFMKPAIHFLKFRISHGYVGHDGLTTRFAYLTRVQETDSNVGFGTNNGYGYGSGKGISITYYGNPDATWEKAAKTDIGLEMHFLEGFRLQADVFYEKRTDIWVALNKTPDMLGFSQVPYANAGEMENKGIDGFLEYSKFFDNGFGINVKGTFSYARNKILKNGDETKAYAYQSALGRPHNSNMGYLAERYFIDEADIAASPSQVAIGGVPKPGDIKYTDYNGDGEVNNFDRVFMGYPTVPEITYGIGANLMYKAFDFSFMFQGADHVSFFGRPSIFSQSNRGNVYTMVRDSYWNTTTQDLNATFPRLAVGDQTKNYTNSSKWLQNGAYIRLKQIEFGYTLPKTLSKKTGMNECRFFVNGLNLLTFSKFKWWDAESKSSNGLYYPIQATINVGIDINF
jgi:TonB-linked SusC/RagA family outer membrane protein